jgi:uncharacterized Zn-binding protein involved in type VI secretion
MGTPAARLGDPTVHGGVIGSGFPTVLIGNQPAARIGDVHACPEVTGVVPHVGGPLILGAFTVMIGNMPQSRVGDTLTCVGPPDAVAMGCQTVTVGMAGGGAGLGGLLMGLALGAVQMVKDAAEEVVLAGAITANALKPAEAILVERLTVAGQVTGVAMTRAGDILADKVADKVKEDETVRVNAVKSVLKKVLPK